MVCVKFKVIGLVVPERCDSDSLSTVDCTSIDVKKRSNNNIDVKNIKKHDKNKQEGQHLLTGQSAASFNFSTGICAFHVCICFMIYNGTNLRYSVYTKIAQ